MPCENSLEEYSEKWYNSSALVGGLTPSLGGAPTPFETGDESKRRATPIMKKKQRGIYIFTDTSTSMKYVGKSIDMPRRIDQHYQCSGSNSHFCHALALRPDLFSLEMIDLPNASNQELNALEISYIHVLNTVSPNGYNLTLGGEGQRPSPEARRRLSEALKGENNPNFGKPHPADRRRKMSEAHKGKTHSPETRKKLSEKNKGRKPTPQVRRKMSEAARGEKNPNYGKRLSCKQRYKLSESHKGKKISPETKKKISQALKGRSPSTEHRQNLSKSQKGKRKGENNPYSRNRYRKSSEYRKRQGKLFD